MPAQSPSSSSRSLNQRDALCSASTARRYRLDGIAAWVVRFGGAAVILSLTAMLLFIASETIPLWYSGDATRVADSATSSAIPEKRVPSSRASAGPDATIQAEFKSEGRELRVTAAPGAGPSLTSVQVSESLFGDAERTESSTDLTGAVGGVTAIAIAADGKTIFGGTAQGELLRWDVRDPQSPKLLEVTPATLKSASAITALASLVGGRSLVVGDASGAVSVWFTVRDSEGTSRFQQVHSYIPLAGAVTSIAISPRDRRFAVAGERGDVVVYYATTGRELASVNAGGKVTQLDFSARADRLIARTGATETLSWSIDNPHPEAGFAALFGPVWYEGYDGPDFVWQSTGGTDVFEPKMSLVPLIFGTMKGTVYALLFAVPIAILAALYTSQFCHSAIRNIVKPLVELMAALPSVVLGFLAGLWLAPALETRVVGLAATVLACPAALWLAGRTWRFAPAAVRHSFRRPGSELALVLPLLLTVTWICFAQSQALELWIFGGELRTVLAAQGVGFDQRNCVVVGFAMGFAVIPIIFTISEDALSNVPQRLVSASLGLGANRWQTALRVVLPTASPGIFSAIMVGFGRAVGETMIVLMATGNTPISEWNVFTGMRTLAANIAVEVPEAPYGGTLYRVLFLSALLLFATTFVVNTTAELVRQRLRKKYQAL